MCDPIHPSQFYAHTTFEMYDAVNEETEFTIPTLNNLYTDWSMKVEYLYHESWQCPYGNDSSWSGYTNDPHASCENESTHLFTPLGWPYPFGQGAGMHLLKATVTRKTEEYTQAVPKLKKDISIYRYGNQGRLYTSNIELKAILKPGTIARCQAEAASFDVNGFLYDSEYGAEYVKPDVEFRRLSEISMVSGPYARELAGSLGLNVNKTVYLQTPDPVLIDRRTDSDAPGTYIIHWYRQYQSEGSDNDVDFTFWENCDNALDCPDFAERYWNRHIGMLHYPYRVPDKYVSFYGNGGTHEWATADYLYSDLSEVRFAVVIDKVSSDVVTGTKQYNPLGTTRSGSGVESRRVVKMNAAGFILEDSTYVDGNLESRVGFSETCKYDVKGRLIERRSEGYSVAEAQDDPLEEGLITFYEYDEDYCVWDSMDDRCTYSTSSSNPFAITLEDEELLEEPIAYGVRRGREGKKYYYAYNEYYTDGDALRPDLPTAQKLFAYPVYYDSATSTLSLRDYLAAQDGIVTEWAYDFHDSTDVPLDERAIKSKITSRSAVPASADDGAIPYHSVIKEILNSDGNETFKGWGSEDDNNGLYEFFFNMTVYNDKGQKLHEVFDVDPEKCDGTGSDDDPDLSSIPDGWTRIATDSTLTALHQKTSYEYDDLFGLTKVLYPPNEDGIRIERHIIYDTNTGSPTTIDVWIFPDYDPNIGRTYSPIQHIRFAGTNVEFMELVELTTTLSEPVALSEGQYTVLSQGDLEYDESGRMTGMAQNEGENTVEDPASQIQTSIKYYPNGLPERTEHPDGTIQRYTFTDRGKLEKTYRGTNDNHLVWGLGPEGVTCDPSDLEFSYLDCIGQFDDNLVLVEKNEYGTGINDAGLLITVRHYDTQPVNQYSINYPLPNGCYDPNDPPDDTTGLVPCLVYPANNEDEIGWAEHHYYDWRMRKVRIELRNKDNEPIRNTLTWYNNLNKEIVVAEYGPNVPQKILTQLTEGTSLLTGLQFPASEYDIDELVNTLFDEALVADSAVPMTLTRNIYNDRELIEETRNYWHEVDSGDPASSADDEVNLFYQATINYYDHSDRPVEIHTSQWPVLRAKYNAQDRLIYAIMVAPGTNKELVRTKSIYDQDEKPTRKIRLERINYSGGDSLDSTNSVSTYQYTWYDDSDRVIAKADFGTNSGSFVNGSEPPYDVDGCDLITYDNNTGDGIDFIETCGCSEYGQYARFTCYGYDEMGRQNQIMDPAGRLTFSEYDAYGNTILTVENYNQLNNDPQRITANLFDEFTGHLSMTAAVKPEHFGTNAVTSSNIDWDRSDGTLQVTMYQYDAVVAQDFGNTLDDVSTNGNYISAVYYPDLDTGLPSNEPAVMFKYDFAGRVVERKDARGVSLLYSYDTQNQLEEIEVDLSDVEAGLNNLLAVSSDVVKLTYDYTGSGQLLTALVEGDGTTLNETSFTYGMLDVLTSASQILDESQAFERTISYGWDTPAEGSKPRLEQMNYPSGTSAGLTFSYGDSGDPDDLNNILSRLSGIELTGQIATPVASWSHLPGGRQVGHSLGNGVGFSYWTGNELTGLDGFGRVIDRDYKFGGNSLLRHQYGYTTTGNVKFTRLTGHPAGDGHSWRYQYDALDRLIQATEGELDASGEFVQAIPPVTLDTFQWQLDALSNLSGGTTNNSFRVFSDAYPFETFEGGDAFSFYDHHDTNEDNSIARRLLDDGADGTPMEIAFFYDKAGNLVFDGEHYFRYDAFNRVTAIYAAGSLQVGTTDCAGDSTCMDDPAICEVGELCGMPGDWLYAYEYDALGRRVKTIEDPNMANPRGYRHVYGSGAETLVEYELVEESGTVTEYLLRFFVWGESFPDPLMLADFTEVDGTPSGEGGSTPATPDLYFYLKDALGSTTALTEINGAIVEGYLYSPYGTTTIWDASGDEITDSGSDVSNPFCYTGQRFEYQTDLYHFWARTYSPELQRWVQKDALGILGYGGGEPARGTGNTPTVEIVTGEVGDEYADLLNLFVYVLSNPVQNNDPVGRMSYTEVGSVSGIQGYLYRMMNAGLSGGFIDVLKVSQQSANCSNGQLFGIFITSFATSALGTIGGPTGYAIANAAQGIINSWIINGDVTAWDLVSAAIDGVVAWKVSGITSELTASPIPGIDEFLENSTVKLSLFIKEGAVALVQLIWYLML